MRKRSNRSMDSRKKNKGNSISQCTTEGGLSKKEWIDIHAEAYYVALKRIEEEKESHKLKIEMKMNKKRNFLLIIKAILLPKHIKSTYCSEFFIMYMTTFILDSVGYLMRIFGIISICNIFIGVNNSLNANNMENIVYIITNIITGVGLFVLRSCFIIVSKEIENLKDKQYLMQFSSCLMSILAVVFSVIAIMK